MNIYTLKKDPKEHLFLVDEQGKETEVDELLRLYPNKRVFAFEGNLGAGKTTFIRQLCKRMDTDDVVNSPTFAIINVYDTKDGNIYHFDCYRLKKLEEALDFGAEEYLYSGQYCFIEWPHIISPILPEDTIWVSIEVQDDGRRIVTIKEEKDE